jgi:hypothetical protein
VRRLASFRVAMGKLQPLRRSHRCSSGASGEWIGDGGRGLDGQREGGEELRQGTIIQQVIVALVFFFLLCRAVCPGNEERLVD